MTEDAKAGPAALEEELKVRKLRRMADLAIIMVSRSNLPIEEAQQVFQTVREAALKMFPDKAETFDLIYGARFRKLMVEKYNLS